MINFKKLKSKILILLMILIFSNFVINTSYIYKYQNNIVCINDENAFCKSLKEKNIDIYISNASVRVTNCYLLNRKERFKILIIIKNHLIKNGVTINRSINNLEAELKLHAVLYNFGMFVNHTKDADLEFFGDSRWQIRSATIFFQILGI